MPDPATTADALSVPLLCAVTLLGGAALIGFGVAMKASGKGFGPFNTSTLLLVLVTSLGAVLAVGGKVQPEHAANLFFAIVGFAGGLFTKSQGQAS